MTEDGREMAKATSPTSPMPRVPSTSSWGLCEGGLSGQGLLTGLPGNLK